MSSLKKQGLLKVINQLNNGNINPAFTESDQYSIKEL